MKKFIRLVLSTTLLLTVAVANATSIALNEVHNLKDEESLKEIYLREKSKEENSKDITSKKREAKDVKVKNDKAKEEMAKEEMAKEEMAKEEKAKNEKAKNEKAKNEKAKNEKAKNEKAKNVKAKNVKAKNEKAKDEKAKDEKAKDEKAKEEKAKEEKAAAEKAKEQAAIPDLISCKSSDGCGLDIKNGIDDLVKPPKDQDVKLVDSHCNESSPSLCQINNDSKLSSIPEPATYALFVVGAVGLISFIRRQTKLKNRSVEKT